MGNSGKLASDKHSPSVLRITGAVVAILASITLGFLSDFLPQKPFLESLVGFSSTLSYKARIYRKEMAKTAPLEMLFIGASVSAHHIHPDIIREHLHQAGVDDPQILFLRLYGTDLFAPYYFLKENVGKRKIRNLFLELNLLYSQLPAIAPFAIRTQDAWPQLKMAPTEEIVSFFGYKLLYGPAKFLQLINPYKFWPTGQHIPDYPSVTGEEHPFGDPALENAAPQSTSFIYSASEKIPDGTRLFEPNPFQQYLLKEIIDLCEKNEVNLYLLSGPFLEEKKTTLLIPQLPPDFNFRVLGGNFLPNLISESEIKENFEDHEHLYPKVGRKFTLSILPELTKIYLRDKK